jgi:hypothetical protein
MSNQYPGATDVSFQENFAVGGFDALIGMSLPNNNPFGFSLGARSELSSRIKGTTLLPQETYKLEFVANKGFLSQKVCIDPNGAPVDINCKRSEVLTPGSTIATSLDKALGNPTDQLLVGTDITTDIGAILDALLNHYMKDGLSKM